MSALEDDLLKALHRSARSGVLKQGPLTDEWIPLGKVFPWSRGKEAQTKPDYYFRGTADVAVYVDGPHHMKSVHAARDDDINDALEDIDIFPLRLPYKRYSTRVLRECRDLIVATVNRRIKERTRARG